MALTRGESTARSVLVVAYQWAPAAGVGGLRVLKFAQYLPDHGWHPMVLTPMAMDSPTTVGVRVVATGDRDCLAPFRRAMLATREASGGVMASPPRGTSRLRRLMRELLTIPDEKRGWIKLALAAGRRFLAEEPVDAIFSTSPPESAHLIARRLSKEAGVPWIADLRDPWSDDHYREWPSWKRRCLCWVEGRVLADADVIVTVSETWAEGLANSHPDLANRLAVIPHGFDPEDYPATPGPTRHERLELLFTGRLHPRHQDPSMLFQALAELITEGRLRPEQVRCRFYLVEGYEMVDVEALAADHGVAPCVERCEPVFYREALGLQQSATALLAVQWTGRGGEGCHTTKLFEYLGARRPILVLHAPDGEVSSLVRACGAGVLTTSVAEVKDCLLKWVAAIEHAGWIPYNGDEAVISRYTRQSATAALAKLLNRAVGG